MIPKNVSESDGPSAFSKAKGIPSCEHTSLIVVRLFWYTSEFGGPREESHPDKEEGVLLPVVLNPGEEVCQDVQGFWGWSQSKGQAYAYKDLIRPAHG